MLRRYFFLFLMTCYALQSQAQQKRPNILIIVSDDHAYQGIGAYGSKLNATPHLDKLAKEGAVFTNAFVTNSLCGPSRACLLTSKYSNLNGFKDNFSSFDPSQPTFASHLTKAGYQTAWIGKWHLVNNPRNFSFFKVLVGQGYYYNPNFLNTDSTVENFQGYCTNIITDITLDWLKNKRDTSEPFCLVVGEKATHRTWMPDTADYGKFDQVTFPLPPNFYDNYDDRYAGKVQNLNIAHTLRLGYDLKMAADTGFGKENYTRMTPSQRKQFDAYYDPIYAKFKEDHLSGHALTEWKYQRYMRDYMSTTLSLDRNIGRIVDYIDESGLGDNTIVIYTSDQGFYLGEHGWFDKRFMYEESMKTPLIIRYPELIKPGTTHTNMVMQLDLAPTFMELAGLEVASDMQGKSLIPLLEGKENEMHDAIFYHYYEYPNEHNALPHFGIRTDRYKLIYFYEPHKFWELYDLKNDPHEMHNIYQKQKSSKLVKTLKQQLKQQAAQYKQRDALQLLSQATNSE